jgi:hypothetical protein
MLWVSRSLIGIGGALPDFAISAPGPEQPAPIPSIINTAASENNAAALEILLPPVDDPAPVISVPELSDPDLPEAEPATIHVADDLIALDPLLSVEVRCLLMRDIHLPEFYGQREGIRAVEFYFAMSDSELQARADVLEDEFAQFFVAQRRLRAIGDAVANGELRPESIPDETIQSIRMYYLKAMRKHVKGSGPSDLAWLYYIHGDRIEAAAWLMIDQRMGGDRLQVIESDRTGFWTFNEYDRSEGALRQEALIAEHDLEGSFSHTDECLQ